MAQLKEEVEIRQSNVLALADALRAATFHREKIKSSKDRWEELSKCRNIFAPIFRCKAEISSWRSEMLKQVEEAREELMEEVKRVHAEAQVSIADRCCSHLTCYLHRRLLSRRRMRSECKDGAPTKQILRPLNWQSAPDWKPCSTPKRDLPQSLILPFPLLSSLFALSLFHPR